MNKSSKHPCPEDLPRSADAVPDPQVALDSREALYRAMREATRDGILLASEDGRIVDVNESTCRLLGYEREELLAMTIQDIDPSAPPEVRRAHLAWIAGQGAALFETEQRRKDGAQVEVEVSATWLPETRQILSHIRDVSERRRFQAALRDSETHYRNLFETVPLGVVYQDAEGRFLSANPAAERLACAAFPGLWDADRDPAEALAVGEDGKPLAARDLPAQVALRTGRPSGRKVIGLGPGDDRIWIEAGATPVFRPGETAPAQVYTLFQDITAQRAAERNRRELEGQVQHLQRMEAIGSLAAGIAHDMNNVLAAILSSASLLQMKGADSPEAALIAQACRRGRDLVRGLMDFARKEIRETEALDLNDLVRREMELLGSTTLQRVDLRMELEADPPPMEGSPTALATALMNLCVNAVDAMPDGGTLTVRTGRAGEGALRLEVEDTGCGMDPEVAVRAMEPFFTTKPRGRGTGLGLAQVFGTAKAHGGTLAIRSEPGKGTCVTLVLPLAKVAPSPGAPPPETSLGPAAPCRVLIVDDDPMVRHATAALLARAGHAVEAVPGGPEALVLLEAGAAFDVVILDHNMPAMTGQETFGRIRQLRPGQPVILSTGFAGPRTPGNAEGVRRLDKPYTFGELQEALAMLRKAALP